jgi:glyoxylase-like metal-dependent hydrolase (beta-lactamase superfamily II)
VFVHELDREGVTHLEQRANDFVPHVHDLLTSWGVPAEQADTLAGFMEQRDWRIQSSPAERLIDGQRLPAGAGELEVIHTPGHTVGSICLLYGDYLFTGDHVLSVLSPNIGGGEFGAPNLLNRYLNSLDRVRALHSTTLSVMPGHGVPWNGVDQICGRLAHHHAERLTSLEHIVLEGKASTIFEMAEALFGRLKGIHLWLGTAEVHSHLEYLIEQGRIRAEDGGYRPA